MMHIDRRLAVQALAVMLAGSLIGNAVAQSECTLDVPLTGAMLEDARHVLSRSPARVGIERRVTSKHVRRWMASGKTVRFVDIRARIDHEYSRLPGSIHVPVAKLPYLVLPAGSSIVLITDAVPGPHVLSAIDRADAAVPASFRVLDGSLHGWRQAGGTLDGDLFGKGDVDRVSPSAYHASRYGDQWLVVRLTHDAEIEAENPFADAVHVSGSGDTASLRDSLARIIDGLPRDQFAHVLLVDDDGARWRALRELTRAYESPLVFQLEGGARAYDRYLQTQQVLIAERRRRAEAPRGRCPST